MKTVTLRVVHTLGAGHGRGNGTDKLIDLMIGFESLYLKDSDSELRFRLAARTSIHLGKNADERQKIF